ncbi:MAG: DNA adenine methylase [Candidatus Sulfotelmatobacter sp.]
MGSKLSMLQNGLGTLIRSRARSAERVVDLFSGSAAVSWFVAENTQTRVLSNDLQEFASVLARAVIGRTAPLDPAQLGTQWFVGANAQLWGSRVWYEAKALERSKGPTKELVATSRKFCEGRSDVGVIWGAYGGHYFSPSQALAIDALRGNLPASEPARSVCLAAVIIAASKCAAAPGHTAQPLSPDAPSGQKSIRDAWKHDPASVALRVLHELCARFSKVAGEVTTQDAVSLAKNLSPGDLAIVDPPYSDVQYSRFYHVLETIAKGSCGDVNGRGRYPAVEFRPQSRFSKRSESEHAMRDLLGSLSEAGASVIVTFPREECSNGLSGDAIALMAQENFCVCSQLVAGRFSTLGGDNTTRKARVNSEELILSLRPKRRRRGTGAA